MDNTTLLNDFGLASSGTAIDRDFHRDVHTDTYLDSDKPNPRRD